MFTVCSDMFPACTSEVLLTLWLKTGRLSIFMGSVQVRSVKFTTGQVPSVYVDGLLGGGVLLLNHYRIASSSRQDGYSRII